MRGGFIKADRQNSLFGKPLHIEAKSFLDFMLHHGLGELLTALNYSWRSTTPANAAFIRQSSMRAMCVRNYRCCAFFTGSEDRIANSSFVLTKKQRVDGPNRRLGASSS